MTRFARIQVRLLAAIAPPLLIAGVGCVAPPAVGAIAVPRLQVDVVLSGLSNPWDVVQAPDGTLLATERSGGFVVRRVDGSVVRPTANLSDLVAVGETGHMGVVLDPQFSSNRRLYSCIGHGAGGSLQDIRVVAWSAAADWTSIGRVQELVTGIPSDPTTPGRHAGCRLRFGADGRLLIGTGDRVQGSAPQDLTSLAGKVLRVDPSNGEAPSDNPFATSSDARTRLLFTLGHRNVQGLAIRPGSSEIWSVEHGPGRDDEVNLLVPGGNYGWNPLGAGGSYDESKPMTGPGGIPAKWSSGSPTVATGGAAFTTGPGWGAWEGALAVATLKDTSLRLQRYDPRGGLIEESIPSELNGTYGRLRSVTGTADGSLLITTSNGSNDRILRVVAKGIGDAGLVSSVYRDFLGRSVDPAGADYWVGQIQNGRITRGQFLLAITGSYEYEVRTVQGLYPRCLNRQADPGGLGSWSSAVSSGQLSEVVVCLSLLASPEAYQRAGGTNQGWVSSVYALVLGRAADPGGLNSWSARTGVVGRDVVAREIFNAAESLTRRIDAAYRQTLGRGADPAGLLSWQGYLAATTDTALRVALANSAEYAVRAEASGG